MLPLDLLDIVGNFAGCDQFRLKFTLSKKRHFLSFIYIKPRYPSVWYPKDRWVLHKNAWKPVRLGCFKSMLDLLTMKMSLTHLNVFRDSLVNLHKLLSEIHDFILQPTNYARTK